MTKAAKKKTAKQPVTGLLGLFGHRLKDGRINNQFEVIRRVGRTRYAIQLFSFWDGGPTNIEIVTEAELCEPGYRFYPGQEEWNHAVEQEARKTRQEERQREQEQKWARERERQGDQKREHAQRLREFVASREPSSVPSRLSDAQIEAILDEIPDP